MSNKRVILLFYFLMTMISLRIEAQTFILTGKITDPKGGSVIGASIKVKNTNLGIISDTLGFFKIRIKRIDSFQISAIGFVDTTVSVGNHSHLTIVLNRQTKTLAGVVIASANQNSGLPSPEEATREQIIANTFDDYMRSAMFSNGAYTSSSFAGGTISITQIPGFGALNGINNGEMLPVVPFKEETRGSRYLLNRFVSGIIVDQNYNIITDSSKLLNYDKIDGQLMITQDARNYLKVDKDKVPAFAFKAGDTSYIFMMIPLLATSNYYLLIANGKKYSAYKTIKTKFETSHYRNTGLTESGNNYDEYIDVQDYYWIDQRNNRSGQFELKRKSIKEAFSMEKEKTTEYLEMHKSDRINDNFIKNLIFYLNQE